MNVDEFLLLGRIAFLAGLYLFLLLLGLLLWRELRVRSIARDERAPADLLMVDPFETDYEAGDRIELLALTTIGRSPDNDVVLADTFVSAEHARLSWNGRNWTVQDLGSTNGTKVNGKSVRRAAGAKAGDMIEFGRVKLKLVAL